MALLLDGLQYSHVGTAAVFQLMVGPGLTTILGQVGGAWGGRQCLKAEQDSTNQLVDSTGATTALSAPTQPLRFQFGIRHVLWVGIWVSLLLTGIRLLGVSFVLVLPLLMGWLIYQAATLWIGERLIRGWVRFRQQRQSCST
jgi:hypothetical protein